MYVGYSTHSRDKSLWKVCVTFIIHGVVRRKCQKLLRILEITYFLESSEFLCDLSKTKCDFIVCYWPWSQSYVSCWICCLVWANETKQFPAVFRNAVAFQLDRIQWKDWRENSWGTGRLYNLGWRNDLRKTIPLIFIHGKVIL